MEQGPNYLYCKNLNGSSSSDDDGEIKKEKRKRSNSKYDEDKDESVSLSSSGGEDMVYLSTKQEIISKEFSPRSRHSPNDDEDIESINVVAGPKSNKKKARESVILTTTDNFHRILPLNVLEKYQQVLGTKKRARLRCKLCHEKTSFFCVKCTKGNYDDIFAICSPLKVPLCDCFYEHVTPVIVTATQTVTIGSSQHAYYSPILYDPRVTGWIDQEYLENPVGMQR